MLTSVTAFDPPSNMKGRRESPLVHLSPLPDSEVYLWPEPLRLEGMPASGAAHSAARGLFLGGTIGWAVGIDLIASSSRVSGYRAYEPGVRGTRLLVLAPVGKGQ